MPRKSSKVDPTWLHDHLTDPYVRQAQRDGYRARSAYKLQALDEQFRLVKPGMRIVDLGAAPGAWSQYLSRKLAGSGRIVALDLLPMEPVEAVEVILGDFRDEAVLAELEARTGPEPLDLVVSDMAPNLSGIAAADAARMDDLLQIALDFASRHLKPDGALVAKAFHGSGFSQTVEAWKSRFERVKEVKPPASRAKSAETFLVGIRPKRLNPHG
jgi:23S rRNA (uridine2552-2'-O)-methyltransferase